LIFAGFAFLAYYEAGKLPFGSISAPGAGFFPAVLAAVLALTSLVGLLATLRANLTSHLTAEPLEPPLFWRKVLLTVALLLAFAGVFELAGYVPATFLFVVSLLRWVERKSWTQAGVVALSASLTSYILFGLLLGAPLPAGFLGA
jgi:putative tricarboxylic transport membrane protein